MLQLGGSPLAAAKPGKWLTIAWIVQCSYCQRVKLKRLLWSKMQDIKVVFKQHPDLSSVVPGHGLALFQQTYCISH